MESVFYCGDELKIFAQLNIYNLNTLGVLTIKGYVIHIFR